MEKENRLEILDSFRFIAILSVMLFHYYSRYISPPLKVSLYPYNNSFDYFTYGYLGVQFFFIISGFVIAFTLTRTINFGEFWKKRIIRLVPPLFICSLITLLLFSFLDPNFIFPESHKAKNLIYSVCVLSPGLINEFMSRFSIQATYINGSYWSLWPEIQFYFVASCIYFIDKKNFFRNFTFSTITICITNYIILRILYNVLSTNKYHLDISSDFVHRYLYFIDTIINYATYALYFNLGVVFFYIYTKRNVIFAACLLPIICLLILFLENGLTLDHFMPVHTIGIMILLFLFLIFMPKVISFLLNKYIMKIGIASYSLYLIHEPIGVLLIHNYASLFGEYSYIFPLLVILLMIFFSVVSFNYIEKPLSLYLKRKFIDN